MMNVNPQEPPMRAGAISPIECFQQGWDLIKDRYWVFLGVTFVGGLLTGFTCGILGAAIACGIALCYLAKARRQYLQFDTLFKGFEYFQQSFLIVVIWIAMYVVMSIPNIGYTIATSPIFNKNAAQSLDVQLVGYSISIGTSVVNQVLQNLMLFACLLVVDRRLSAWDATRVSFQALFANLGGFLGLVGLSVVASLVGVLACCVGTFFVVPVIYGAVVAAYFQVFPDTEMPFAPPDMAPPSPFRPPYA
jgi:uncharacterized membrane protein